jgi:hypothetical protein
VTRKLLLVLTCCVVCVLDDRYIQSTCATTGEGLYEGLDWLSSNIASKVYLWHDCLQLQIYLFDLEFFIYFTLFLCMVYMKYCFLFTNIILFPFYTHVGLRPTLNINCELTRSSGCIMETQDRIAVAIC